MENMDPVSKSRLWSGRIISTLAILFMLFDGIIHFLKIPAVTQAYMQMGYSLSVIRPLAVIELISIVLYIIPQTSVLGAILLTGYLGGAVDSNVHAGNALFGYVLAPVYVAIFLWGGLWLRSNKISNLIPFRK